MDNAPKPVLAHRSLNRYLAFTAGLGSLRLPRLANADNDQRGAVQQGRVPYRLHRSALRVNGPVAEAGDTAPCPHAIGSQCQ